MDNAGLYGFIACRVCNDSYLKMHILHSLSVHIGVPELSVHLFAGCECGLWVLVLIYEHCI